MPYGTLALDTISTSGNLAITGNVATSGNLTITGNVSTSGSLSATGNIISSGRIVESVQECAQLGSTVTYTLPNANIVIVPFDTAVILQGITVNATASTVNGIEAYHWRHSTTGIFRLVYQVRTVTDGWNMISVCRNNNTALPAGNSYRTGAPSGAWGIAYECLYKVSNTSDRFGLFHWGVQNMNSMLAHAVGNPASSFFVTPDSGTAPTTGYYNTITITRV